MNRIIAAALALALVMPIESRAETPQSMAVMAFQIDDLITLDPAEIYELTGGEYAANVYDRLVYYDIADISDIKGGLAESWQVSDDGKTFTLAYAETPGASLFLTNSDGAWNWTAAEPVTCLVDDEEVFVEALARRLSARGLHVETAENGKVAIEKAQQQPFDAVVLDLAMPKMDGMETLKRLLELNPDQQIILLTGHGSVQKGVEAMKAGAMDFLEKPAELKDLLAKIEQASENTMHLVEKRTTEHVAEVLRKKGW